MPADLKARLALAGLRGDPAPWDTPEARQAGVTAGDVEAWQDVLAGQAARLFDAAQPLVPLSMADLLRERDDLRASLAARFEELAVLTRLLEGKRQPWLQKDRIQEFRQDAAERRKRFAHGAGTLKIRVVQALPAPWKRRVKAVLARLRA